MQGCRDNDQPRLGPATGGVSRPCAGTSGGCCTRAAPSPRGLCGRLQGLARPQPGQAPRAAPCTSGRARRCPGPGMQEGSLGSWHGGMATHQKCASWKDDYAFGANA